MIFLAGRCVCVYVCVCVYRGASLAGLHVDVALNIENQATHTHARTRTHTHTHTHTHLPAKKIILSFAQSRTYRQTDPPGHAHAQLHTHTSPQVLPILVNAPLHLAQRKDADCQHLQACAEAHDEEASCRCANCRAPQRSRSSKV